jgi:hypothetical protein
MKKKMLAERSKTRRKPSDRYPLFVSWSDKDQAFIGYCPSLFLGGVCHDENRIAAYSKLVEIVEEDIQSRLEKGEILPELKNDIWFAEAATTEEGTKEFEPMAPGQVLEPRGVVAGIWNRPNRYLKHLDVPQSAVRKVKSAKVTRKRATDSNDQRYEIAPLNCAPPPTEWLP